MDLFAEWWNFVQNIPVYHFIF